MTIDKKDNLKAIIRDLQSVVIGFSGGVDSTLLVKLCLDILGAENVWVVTGNSASIMSEELDFCRQMSESFKIMPDHFRIIQTNELDDPNYVANTQERCFFCKDELFIELAQIKNEIGAKAIVDGSNASDLNDYRPGLRAKEKFSVRSPFIEAGFTKEDIRSLAKELGLPNWDKPAMPCLSSRIPYGSAVTKEKLEQIGSAERFLRSLGFTQFRVRHHGQVARLEILLDDFEKLLINGVREKINAELKKIGFTFVAVDLGGFKSGNLNVGIKQKDKDV